MSRLLPRPAALLASIAALLLGASIFAAPPAHAAGLLPLTTTISSTSQAFTGGFVSPTVYIRNPNGTAIPITRVIVTKPAGWTYVARSVAPASTIPAPTITATSLTFTFSKTVPASGTFSFGFTLGVGKSTGTFALKASGRATGTTVSSSSVSTSVIAKLPNRAPVASRSYAYTLQGTAVVVPLSYSDVDGDSLSIHVGQPAHGTLALRSGVATYTPASGFVGLDTFTFSVNDGKIESNTATASIDVTRRTANTAPTARSQTVTMAEVASDAAGVGIALDVADAEDGEAGLTTVVTVQPRHGRASISTSGSAAYYPTPGWNGTDSFTYRITDSQAASATATVTIRVTPVELPPQPNGIVVQVNRNSSATFTVFAIDLDSPSLTLKLLTRPTRGTLTGTMPNFTYTPNTDVIGTDSFTFSSSDGTTTVTNTVVFGIRYVHATPVAAAQSVIATQSNPVRITLKATDANGEELFYLMDRGPQHGTLTGTIPNLVYTSAAGYTGADSFTFRATNKYVVSEPATISINVTAGAHINQAPTATDGRFTARQGTPAPITLLGIDPEGSSLSYTITAQPTLGALTGSGSSRVYTPIPGAIGLDTITFSVSDGSLRSAIATVRIELRSANHAPVAQAFSKTVAKDSATNYFPLYSSDADRDVLTNILSTPAHGTVVILNDGLAAYTPTLGYTGTDSLTFTVNDGFADSAPVKISFTVN
ncbi:Ig-like domain-containing protein [Naasia lichenicola]|uniref:Tandem-95 repeat protein n=1 Tax=Naasia lichenicola TaxID=2565933 RepID=A0A4S4FKA0_9MICO|nr:Ig-like domain-containing protein [Naasia lichenicola]THG30810.1 tandem-95 repeat protein [Naasia lichenicola]